MAGGMGYIAVHVSHDLEGTRITASWPFLLLGAALLIALGFRVCERLSRYCECRCNSDLHQLAGAAGRGGAVGDLQLVRSTGFHGRGGLRDCGAAAGGSDPAGGSRAGFAMVFALLIAAILWNLGTWWLGLPASSSHTLVGSIMGVGIANQLLNARERDVGSGLGAGAEGSGGAVDFAGGWVCGGGICSSWFPSVCCSMRNSTRPAEGTAAAVSYPRVAGAYLHRREFLPRLE